jgi:acetate kinase
VEILCLDAGSSSLKFAAYRLEKGESDLALIAAGSELATPDADAALGGVIARVHAGAEGSFAAVGHRIVFGGRAYVEPTLVDDDVLGGLEQFIGIAPLHLRAELDLVHAVRRRIPTVPQILCFDTAFHMRSPAIARRLPLPRDIDPLVQRYGFHGLSYEYVVSELHDRRPMVIAHLGAGASLCAVRDGLPVDTTMGFSPLGGLMMATRPGDLDPGILLRLLEGGYDFKGLSDLLYNRSGLLGVSGSSADMKTLLSRSAGDPFARAAIELFVYQLVKQLGAMIAVLGGVKALVFTGGIGERAAAIRTDVCAAFAYMGLRLTDAANVRNERTISDRQSSIAVMVVPTDENLMIARHALTRLKKDS